MPGKRDRQAAILEIVAERPVSSQEELRRLLRRRGWDVTQATLSRDLRELGLARVPAPSGVRYALPDQASEEPKPVLETMLPPLFVKVEGVAELAVLRTLPGGAQPIGAALDSEEWPDILGTLAGDDTILIICRSAAARERVVRRITALAQAG